MLTFFFVCCMSKVVFSVSHFFSWFVICWFRILSIVDVISGIVVVYRVGVLALLFIGVVGVSVSWWVSWIKIGSGMNGGVLPGFFSVETILISIE